MSAPIGIYVRVSRKGDREDDRFHSPKEQEDRARGLIEARGYVADSVFSDIDVSGATPPAERPAMGELLQAVERGELAGVAAYSLDRLSREPAHGDALVKRVTKAGGVLLTPDIPDAIDSPTGEFTFGMLLQVARLYRSQAGARFESAKERAIRSGIPVGPAPLGYRKRADRTLEPDPETAGVVRELYERRASTTEGYTSLAKFLTEATGRPWSREGAARVLRNRIYATGRLQYGDIVSDVATDPLVDEPLWHAAQSTETRRPARSARSGFLLTGLVRCAGCGRALQPHIGARRRRRDPRRGKMDYVDVPNPPRRYRCRDIHCTARANVLADRLEQWVALQSFALGDDVATRAEAPDLGALEDALSVAERRLDQVLAPEARDALGDLWAADVKARRAERDAAATALGLARQAAGVPATEFRLRDVWDELAPADRRAALGLFWKTIYVGRPNGSGTPLRLVARGPHAEAEVELPEKGGGGSQG